MKFRIVGVGVAVVLSATTLTACRSNVGVAARVNGETISESQVTEYLSKDGQDATVAQQAAAQGQSLTPARVLVLRFEVNARLFERALKANGGIPPRATVQAARDLALSTSDQAAPTDAALRGQFDQVGIKPSFLPTYLKVVEYEYILVQRLRLAKAADLTAVVEKSGAKVSVSPRYGEWDAQNLLVTAGAGAGLPSFVKLRPTAAASPSVPAN